MYVRFNGVLTRVDLVRYLRIPPYDLLSRLLRELSRSDCSFDKIDELLRINDNFDLNSFDIKHGNTPLHVAAMNHCCKLEVIQLLIRRGASLSAQNRDLQTALHISLDNQFYNYDVINELLFRGAPVDISDYIGCTPLHNAVLNEICDEQIIKAILNNGCDVNIQTNYHSPFKCLLMNKMCSLKTVQLLLDYGAQVDDETVLTYITEGNCKVDIFRKIISGINVALIRHEKQQNVFHLVVKNEKCYDILPYLIETIKLELNTGDIHKETPLFTALTMKRVDKRVINLLLKEGADVNIPNIIGQFPLHKALECKTYNIDIIGMLLDAGAYVSRLDNEGRSPLNLSLKRYLMPPETKRELVELLLKHSVKQSFEDHEEWDYTMNRKCLRISVCPDVKDFEYHGLSDYIDNCLQELIGMKKIKLLNNVSIFDVIKYSKPKLNDSLVEKLLTLFCYDDYPIYWSLVADSITRTQLIQVLHKQEFCIISDWIFPNKFSLVSHCVDNLVKYLSNQDLFKICLVYCV